MHVSFVDNRMLLKGIVPRWQELLCEKARLEPLAVGDQNRDADEAA